VSGKVILSDAMLSQMCIKGLIPPECKRVTIELNVGEPIQIRYDSLGADDILGTLPGLEGIAANCGHPIPS